MNLGYTNWNHNVSAGLWEPMLPLNLKDELTPGFFQYYKNPATGKEFLRDIPVNLDGLLQFKKGPIKTVFDQVDSFWSNEESFRIINKKIKVLYKRGILLYGPPGCGKSSVISMVMRDVISRGGVGIKFSNETQTRSMIRYIREIQPKTSIVVVFEDVDQIMQRGEEQVLNFLDGVETTMDNILFLGTTNHIDQCSARLLRPSRFDLKVELDFPEAVLRERYLKQLVASTGENIDFDLKKSVDDTAGMSFADIKELFISTCIFKHDYKECLAGLGGANLTLASVKRAEQSALQHRMKAAQLEEKAQKQRQRIITLGAKSKI